MRGRAGILGGWRATSGWVLGLALASSAGAANVVVDHTNWNWYVSQGAAVTNTVAAQSVFFAHASVGGYILQGFADLNAGDPGKYPLGQTVSGGTPPGATPAGVIYEFGRGNPDWSVKVSSFASYIGNGWHAPQVGWAMNKFCYIDQNADWATYRDSMTALEAAYPGTRFIYWTLPLMTTTDADAVLRAQFNLALRGWIATQDHKLLFDIADIEAWSPAGVHNTFLYNGTAYESLDAAYSLDGGHPNPAGSQRLATGLYSLLGLALAAPGTGATATPGLVAGPPKVFPNPAKGRAIFLLPAGQAGTASIEIFNTAGETVARLTAAVGGADTQVVWDTARVAPGVYSARVVRTDHMAVWLKFAVVR